MQKIVSSAIFVTGIIAVLLIGGTISNGVGTATAEKRDAAEKRLQQLEDREDIRELLMNYGRFLDQRDFVSFSQLFAEKDGEWNGGMGVAKGPQAIRKLMEETIGKNAEKAGPPNLHIFTNETIHVSGDRAVAATKWMFVVQNAGGQPQPMYIGHYEDSLVREGGRWKFQRRVVHADIPGDDEISRK